jgi:hypothetical protein
MLLAGLLNALQLVGEVEEADELLAAPVGDAREVAALQVVGDGHHGWRILPFQRLDRQALRFYPGAQINYREEVGHDHGCSLGADA